tara:strand:+ start:826 stop:1101 length:276 start_codon:yes stop_codon:yes gene_type:complete
VSELFSLYWWDVDGNQHREIQLSVLDDAFREAVVRLAKGPAAQLGVVSRIMITDSMDLVAWDHKFDCAKLQIEQAERTAPHIGEVNEEKIP